MAKTELTSKRRKSLFAQNLNQADRNNTFLKAPMKHKTKPDKDINC